jgi:hypothetical protein
MAVVSEQLENAIESLKDFQRAAVDSAIKQFNSGNNRVLIADEVGLGKTVVAKGIIARLVQQKLQETHTGTKAFRVTYVCSNLALAEENRKKLAIFRGEAQQQFVREPSFSRLIETALVKNTLDEEEKLLELCSLTPTTSFNLTQGDGNKYERAIICAALKRHPVFADHHLKLHKLFRGDIQKDENWLQAIKDVEKHDFNSCVIDDFHNALNAKINSEQQKQCGFSYPDATWLSVIHAYCEGELAFSETKQRFRTKIRSLLALCCAAHLDADLFILDEFQRFKELLDTNNDNEAAIIARQIFGKENSKILLLSATPFKAVSTAAEDENGDAHSYEVIQLLAFLSKSNQEDLVRYRESRQSLQQQLLSLRDKEIHPDALDDKHKAEIQRILRKYISRTERGQIAEGYNSIFHNDIPSELERAKDFSDDDIQSYKVFDSIALALTEQKGGRNHRQIMDFYKSAPWPMSFLSGYVFKDELDRIIHNGSEPKLLSTIKKAGAAWLSRQAIKEYKVKLAEAPQPKMRALVKRLFNTNSEELLWIPPSLPHYPLQGAFSGQENFSKTLLFSHYSMVPKAISSLVSYEAERRTLLGRKGLQRDYFKEFKQQKIRFSGAQSSLVGWSLVYPAKVFINMPLVKSNEPLNKLITVRKNLIRPMLDEVRRRFTSNFTSARRRTHSHNWFALAPMMLDIVNGYQNYCQTWLNSIFNGEQSSEYSASKFRLAALVDDDLSSLDLGEYPNGLLDYLAILSIAGPAVASFRAWQSIWFDTETDELARAATEIAFSFIAMFNKREAVHILAKKYPRNEYFEAIAKYCAEGDLQAMLQEYGHLLKDAGHQMSGSGGATVKVNEVLHMHTSSISCQFAEDRAKVKKTDVVNDSDSQQNKLRCHYAVPMGNQRLEKEEGQQRIANIRSAFNSPFRPFMLNSTSIGQEGLDFHWYCSNIVHWHLPGNPIDIEQREGRINRYKSLVVRRRVAENYLVSSDNLGGDVWKLLFDQVDEKTKNNRASDLTPYWHLGEGSAKISRFFPMFPLSKDSIQLERALKILAIYRLAFGQPRQDDLFEKLLKRNFTDEEIQALSKKLVVNLSPLLKKET